MRLAAFAAGFLLLLGCTAYAAPVTTIQDPTDVNRNMAVNADGSINAAIIGGGDASAANQVITNTALGAPGDTVCGTSTGTCDIIQLLKYLGSGPMPTSGGCPTVIPISQTASADLHTSSGKTYICAILIVAPDAEVVSLVEGTGSVCATGIAAIIGSTTAANGTSLAANGGYQMSSTSPIFNTQTSNDHLCLLQSGSGRVAGFIAYNDH